MKKYLDLPNGNRILSCALFDEVKENLTVFEAKMIWYLRHSQAGITFNFHNLAEKFYIAHKSKLALINMLETDE